MILIEDVRTKFETPYDRYYNIKWVLNIFSTMYNLKRIYGYL